MIFDGLQALNLANGPEGWAIGSLCPLFGRVHETQIDRIDAEFPRQFIHRTFDGKCRDLRARSTISRRLGPIGNHIPANDQNVFEVIAGIGAHRRRENRRPWKSARLEHQFGPPRGDLAVPLGANLDLHVRTRVRARGPEDLVAMHGHFYGSAAFA